MKFTGTIHLNYSIQIHDCTRGMETGYDRQTPWRARFKCGRINNSAWFSSEWTAKDWINEQIALMKGHDQDARVQKYYKSDKCTGGKENENKSCIAQALPLGSLQ